MFFVCKHVFATAAKFAVRNLIGILLTGTSGNLSLRPRDNTHLNIYTLAERCLGWRVVRSTKAPSADSPLSRWRQGTVVRTVWCAPAHGRSVAVFALIPRLKLVGFPAHVF